MSRPIQVHPASLAAGILLAGLCFLAMSQATVSMPLRVEYMPHPRDMVQIYEGTPYTVPAGRIFTLTALGSPSVSSTSSTILKVNGVALVSSALLVSGGSNLAATSFVECPTGFSAAAGVTLEVHGSSDTGCAWGYLVNQ